MDEEQKKTLAKWQRQCAMREYCRADILKRTGDAEVVEALVEDAYIDDARYARAFARDKAAIGGWGPIKIRQALRIKGIDEAEISEALGEIDGEKAALKLEKALQSKWKAVREEPDGKLKLLKFALGRGYDYEAIKPIVERITKEEQ